MNSYHFLTIAERLVALYKEGRITATENVLTEEFIALVREAEDAVSNVE